MAPKLTYVDCLSLTNPNQLAVNQHKKVSMTSVCKDLTVSFAADICPITGYPAYHIIIQYPAGYLFIKKDGLSSHISGLPDIRCIPIQFVYQIKTQQFTVVYTSESCFFIDRF